MTPFFKVHQMPAPSVAKNVAALAGWLSLSGVLGVVGATSFTCGVGLIGGTNTWCGLGLFWVIGWPLAVVSAFVIGLPACFLFRLLGIRHWLWFAMGGVLVAVPLWALLAQPFDSPRWYQSGVFDSLNYLGSGLLAGLFFWFIAVREESKNAL